MAEGRLHQGLRRDPAVFGQDGLFQRAPVDPDADGNAVGPAGVGHRLHPVGPADVAGVDADLVHPCRHRLQGQAVVEVDVRHQGDGDALLDGPDGVGRRLVRDSHPDDLTPRLGQAADLGHSGLHVVGAGVAHGLDGDGGSPADGDAPRQDLSGHSLLPSWKTRLRRRRGCSPSAGKAQTISFTMSLKATTAIRASRQRKPAALI